MKQMIRVQRNCWGVCMSPTIRQMVLWQPDSRTKEERETATHPQSHSDAEKLAAVTMETAVNNVRFTQD